MDAKLLEERTVFKVGAPAWVERIRFATDFQMPADADVRWSDQLQPDDFSVGRPFSGVCRGNFLVIVIRAVYPWVELPYSCERLASRSVFVGSQNQLINK